MTNYDERSSSPEWSQSLDFYDEDVLTDSSEELVGGLILDNGGDHRCQVSPQWSDTRHRFNDSKETLYSFPDEHNTEIDSFSHRYDLKKSLRCDNSDSTRQQLRPRSSSAPIIVQGPLRLPQGEPSLSFTRKPQARASTDSTRSTPPCSLATRWTLHEQTNSSFPCLPLSMNSSACARELTVALGSTNGSYMVDVEKDHFLPTTSRACFPKSDIITSQPLKYLHETDRKASSTCKAFALLILLQGLVLGMVTVVVYFAAFKKDSKIEQTMAPTTASSAGNQPDLLTFTVTCNGRDTIMTINSIGRYEALTTETIVPNVYSSWDHSLNSCDPANQAVVWLSTRSTENNADWLQSYLMVLTYFSTVGVGWKSSKNWLTDQSVCDWEGIGCDSQGSILKMDLAENILTGPVSSSRQRSDGMSRHCGNLALQSRLCCYSSLDHKRTGLAAEDTSNRLTRQPSQWVYPNPSHGATRSEHTRPFK